MIEERLLTVLRRAPAGLATDFDGTLSPIVWPPEVAAPLDGVADTLALLARRLSAVAILSGRSVGDLRTRIGAPGALLIGNHGAEWAGADGSSPGVPPGLRLRLFVAATILRLASRAIAGVQVEPKGWALAVHYRAASDPERTRRYLARIVQPLGRVGLAAHHGKSVVDLRPAGGATKGDALERLVRHDRLGGLVFFGDDITDIDGFVRLRAMRERGAIEGAGVAVLGGETPERVRAAADLALDGPEAVARCLAALASRL